MRDVSQEEKEGYQRKRQLFVNPDGNPGVLLLNGNKATTLPTLDRD